MNKCFFLILIYFVLICPSIVSQKRIIPLGEGTISLPKGDKSMEFNPSDDSERIKFNVEILKDDVTFQMKVEKFTKGKRLKEDHLTGTVATSVHNKKGNKIFFEVVPDISSTTKLVLFTYFPTMTSFKYMFCEQGKCIKYKQFVYRPDSVNTKEVPLMLFYVDDPETNQVEKKIHQFTENDKLTPGDTLDKNLYPELEDYMLLHYSY